jgi:hypothetical protein
MKPHQYELTLACSNLFVNKCFKPESQKPLPKLVSGFLNAANT